MLLKVDEIAWRKLCPLVELEDIIMPRKAHLGNRLIFQQTNDGRRQSQVIEAEEETRVMSGHLQEGHFVILSFLERRTRLRINAENGLGQEVVNGSLSLPFRNHHDDFSFKMHNGKSGDAFLVKLLKYCLHIKIGAKLVKKCHFMVFS